MRELKRNYRDKKPIHHALLAIDFENEPETGRFICAGVFGRLKKRAHDTFYRDSKPFGKYFDDLNELQNYLMALKKYNCELAFFNAGYDKAFIPNIVDASSVLENRGRLITMKLKNGIKCIDLCNHVSGSLADWMGYLDMENRFGIKKESLEDTKRRVMSDAEATFRLGEFIEDFYIYECNVPMKLTLPATTLRLFTQTFLKDYWFRSDADCVINKLERHAYYGGRVEMFSRGKHTCKSYDVNSMYLSVMREALIPDMLTTEYISNGKGWQKHFYSNELGIYHCKVKAPKLRIMVLPYRNEKGKLIFPSGVFTGWWTSVELKVALEYGYEILEVYEFIYYRRAKRYFERFAEFIWEKRKAYKAAGNLGMEMLIKKMGNSLYGKFGQQNLDAAYMGSATDCPPFPPEAKHYYFKHPVTGEVWIWVAQNGEAEPAKFEFPAVCAFITSYARIKLLRAMKANEARVIYCDTDSIKLQGELQGVEIGDGLGQWGYEGDFEYHFYKPKWYGDKCKGVPSRARQISLNAKEAVYEYDKPLREREALRRSLVPNQWVTVRKFLSLLDDKRAWRGDNSFPIILNEFSDTTITDYAAMDVEYGFDDSRYKTKVVAEKLRREDDMSPDDRRQAALAKQDRRRSNLTGFK